MQIKKMKLKRNSTNETHYEFYTVRSILLLWYVVSPFSFKSSVPYWSLQIEKLIRKPHAEIIRKITTGPPIRGTQGNSKKKRNSKKKLTNTGMLASCDDLSTLWFNAGLPMKSTTIFFFLWRWQPVVTTHQLRVLIQRAMILVDKGDR